jgi:hypothetical protein
LQQPFRAFPYAEDGVLGEVPPEVYAAMGSHSLRVST